MTVWDNTLSNTQKNDPKINLYDKVRLETISLAWHNNLSLHNEMDWIRFYSQQIHFEVLTNKQHVTGNMSRFAISSTSRNNGLKWNKKLNNLKHS